MTANMPSSRVFYVAREVTRYRDDVAECQHAQERPNISAFEDLVAKAVFLFGRLADLDTTLQEANLLNHSGSGPDLSQQVHDLYSQWLQVTQNLLLPQVGRLEAVYGSVANADELRKSVSEVEGILTPDITFFAHEKLAALRDSAIESHRSGDTAPLVDDGK